MIRVGRVHTVTQKSNYGFTIVELLIVIVVIAILAAISIVAYRGIQDRAHDTAVASDAAAFAKKLEIFKVENGHYPTSYADLNEIHNFKLTRDSYNTTLNNGYYYVDSKNSIYAVGLRSKSRTGYMLINGVTKVVGKGGLGGISGATTASALSDAGGTRTFGTTFYTKPNWNSSIDWLDK